MSVDLFQSQKQVLENHIENYRTFLEHHLNDYEIPPADITLLKEWVDNLKSKLTQDIGKSLEEALKGLMVPTWKTIFEADNYIDTGKTLQEQRVILENILKSLRESKLLVNVDLPSHIVEIVNRDFLSSEYKCEILTAELTAEYNLTDSSITWIDAMCERIRVMYYSACLVGDINGIQSLLTKFFPGNALLIDEIISEIKPTVDLNTIITETRQLIPNQSVTIADLFFAAALICIGVAPSDDWMDLEEDLQNHKITGITRAIEAEIEPKHILSSTIVYIQNNIQSFPEVTQWYIQLMTLMYHDLPACYAFCKETSPYMFQCIFQRK